VHYCSIHSDNLEQKENFYKDNTICPRVSPNDSKDDEEKITQYNAQVALQDKKIYKTLLTTKHFEGKSQKIKTLICFFFINFFT
jgi:hypothetical protein